MSSGLPWDRTRTCCAAGRTNRQPCVSCSAISTAFRAYLPKDAKVAVQATVPLFYGEPSSHGPMIERLRRWNEQPSTGAVVRCRNDPPVSAAERGGGARRSGRPDHAADRPAEPAGADGTGGRGHRPAVARCRTVSARQGDLGHGVESRRGRGCREGEPSRDDDAGNDAATGHAHDPGFPAAPAGDGFPVLLDPLQARQSKVHVPGGPMAATGRCRSRWRYVG